MLAIDRTIAHTIGARTFGRTFASLRYRNYRLWFVGQLASMMGSVMQSSVMAYYAYELTKSTAFLGLLGFVTGLPTCLLLLYGGVIADRVSRRRLFMASQFGAMVLAVILTVLAFLQMIEPWHLLALSFLLGVTVSFETPARHALLVDLVEPDHYPNAIALNGVLFQSAMTLGPAIGGVIYIYFGLAWCFAANSLSFIVVLSTLSMISERERLPGNGKRSLGAELSESLRSVYTDKLLWTLATVVTVYSLFGTAYLSLTAAWAVETLHGDAETNGYLNTARGLGALLATFLVAYLGSSYLRRYVIVAGSFVGPIALILMGAVNTVIPAYFVMALVGWSFICILNITNALVQQRVSDQMRGRVMSVFSLAFFGMTPLCSLWTGVLAERFGTPSVFVFSGVLTLVLLGFILLRQGGYSNIVND